jgi:hypothetical protein
MYDLSIIIPYYKKEDEFKYALYYNKDQYKLAKEVILIIDEPIDNYSKLDFLMSYGINFRIFMNTENHEWRNPAPVINHGIMSATSKYCIILSPETILLDDVIKNLLENTDDESFSVGQVIFLKNKDEYEDNMNKDVVKHLFSKPCVRNMQQIGPVYFGSICCTRENFLKVNNYNEDFILWGGEDDNIREKLIKKNIKCKKLNNVNLIHIESENEFMIRYKKLKNVNLPHLNNNDNKNFYKNFTEIML